MIDMISNFQNFEQIFTKYPMIAHHALRKKGQLPWLVVKKRRFDAAV